MFDGKRAQEIPANGNAMRWEPPKAESTPESAFITLTCPSCGGRLQITRDIDRFACGHCGNEHLVRREGGLVYLAPIAEDIRQIRGGVDKTAAELAVVRLGKEVDQLERRFATLSGQTLDSLLPPSWFETWSPLLAFVLPLAAFFVIGMIFPSAPDGNNESGMSMAATLLWLTVPTLPVGCIVIGLNLQGKRTRAATVMKTDQLAEIKTAILEKHVLLKKNQLIVDG